MALRHGGCTDRKMKRTIKPNGRELFFDKDSFLVSKTDLRGRITYANQAFCNIAGYAERELIGQPHNVIRHPDMPRAVFKLLWDRVQAGKEIFAYVKNLSRSGDFYWVIAHVTPSFGPDRQIVGYHSNRRVPRRDVLENVITPLYADLLRIESDHRNAKEGLKASYDHLVRTATARHTTYDEFIFSL